MRIIYCILGCFFLFGCNLKQSNELRFSSNTWAGYEAIYLARHLKYLDDLNIRLIENHSTTNVLRAFRSGAIDAAGLTLDEAILLQSEGIDLIVLLVTDVSNGADVVLSWDENLTSSSLIGKRIGVENTALGGYMLTRFLQKHNVQVDSIHIVSSTVDEHEILAREKKVDIVITFGRSKPQLLQAGMHEVFSSKEIHFEIVDVLVVRRSYFEQNRAQVKQLKESWFQALDYFHQQRDSAVHIMASRTNGSDSELLETLSELDIPDRNMNDSLLSEGVLWDVALQLKAVMLESGLIMHDFELELFTGNID